MMKSLIIFHILLNKMCNFLKSLQNSKPNVQTSIKIQVECCRRLRSSFHILFPSFDVQIFDSHWQQYWMYLCGWFGEFLSFQSKKLGLNFFNSDWYSKRFRCNFQFQGTQKSHTYFMCYNFTRWCFSSLLLCLQRFCDQARFEFFPLFTSL